MIAAWPSPGLWDQWKGPKDAPEAPLAPPLLSFSIATCAPNATVAPIHDRMPVLFTREAEWDAWLHPDAAPDDNSLTRYSHATGWTRIWTQ
jgi:putative SOS response-associated peptidase YedK